MPTVKTNEEIAILRSGGKRLSAVLKAVMAEVKGGVSSAFLNNKAEELIRSSGDFPAFLHYTPYGAPRAYPATLCVSINDEVVHGIPNEAEKILKDGDIVGLDIGLKHEGLYVDMAVTVPVGNIDGAAKKLLETTQKALEVGINVCRLPNRIYDIGCAIEKFAKPFGYGVVEELGGHAVGYKQHEEPYIPNFCIKGKSPKLKPGMVLALEPMLNEGTKHVFLDENDGYTYKTADGKRSAHFEHTVLITDGEPEILTSF